MAERGPNPTSENYIASEQAVIIWDEAHKIEHFIRQADIRTKDPDLGFLVPTPQTPELVEVDPSIFQLAADMARPKKVREVIYHTPLQIFGSVLRGPAGLLAAPFFGTISGMSDRSPDEPEIISEQDIAGYHAVILAADDANGLAQWLKQNGYETTPELEAWFKPYIAAKWKITAFKLIKTKPSGITFSSEDKPIITHAIRMSFATDRPFFPYSEPGDKHRARVASPYGRALRVAVLSTGRMQGNLDDLTPWAGDLYFAGSPTPASDSVWKTSDWLAFAKLDGRLTLPTTLTYWRDLSNPRPGTTDLYFSAAADQSSFRKTEIDYSLPARYWLDLSNPISDLAGLLIAVLLPGVPLYCGWRIINLNRACGFSATTPPSGSKYFFAADQIFGFIAIVMGSFYSICCLVISYWLLDVADMLPGKPLPFFANSTIGLAVAGLLWTLVYSGVRAFRCEPTTKVLYVHRTAFGRFADYLMAGGAILIGVAFLFAVGVAFIGSFFGMFE